MIETRPSYIFSRQTPRSRESAKTGKPGCAVETFELGGIGRLCFGCFRGLVGVLVTQSPLKGHGWWRNVVQYKGRVSLVEEGDMIQITA